MKRLFFLSVLLLFSCSKDNNDTVLTTDPIIGTWVDSSTGGSSRGTITILSNGIALSAIEGNTCWFKSWRTAAENPDYTQVRRYYEFTYVAVMAEKGNMLKEIMKLFSLMILTK